MQSWLLCIVKTRNGFTLGNGWNGFGIPKVFYSEPLGLGCLV